MPKHQNAIRVSFPITFPINSGLLAFTAGSLLVGNNTAATIYVSNSQPDPIPSGSNTIPPYTALPIYGFYGDQVYVGFDGATLRDTDSIGIDAFEEVYPAFPSVQISQPNYYDKPDPVYLGISTFETRFNGTYLQGSYTVPLNRKAFIDAVYLDIDITQAVSGGAVGFIESGVLLDLPTTVGNIVGRVKTYQTAPGFIQMAPYAQIGPIGAGSSVRMYVTLDRTAGIYGAQSFVKITEFDA